MEQFDAADSLTREDMLEGFTAKCVQIREDLSKCWLHTLVLTKAYLPYGTWKSISLRWWLLLEERKIHGAMGGFFFFFSFFFLIWPTSPAFPFFFFSNFQTARWLDWMFSPFPLASWKLREQLLTSSTSQRKRDTIVSSDKVMVSNGSKMHPVQSDGYTVMIPRAPFFSFLAEYWVGSAVLIDVWIDNGMTEKYIYITDNAKIAVARNQSRRKHVLVHVKAGAGRSKTTYLSRAWDAISCTAVLWKVTSGLNS